MWSFFARFFSSFCVGLVMAIGFRSAPRPYRPHSKLEDNNLERSDNVFIHNQFTIYLNAQFHIDEQNKISPLGIKSYYHSKNEPIMLTDNDLMIFIHGRVFNLQQLNNDASTDTNNVESDKSDTLHILLTIYKTYGIEYLLQVMRGEFVMVIIDQRVELDEAKIYAVSESMGIIPLYVSSNDKLYVISTQPYEDSEFEQYTYPGKYAQFSLRRIVHASWTYDPRMNIHAHYSMSRLANYMENINYDLPNVLNHQFYLSIWDRFKRDTTTTHVCCLYQGVHPKETCTEYNILCNYLKKVCKKKNIIFSGEDISHPSTTRVFMVFGGCITSTEEYKTSDKTNLQIDYELRNRLRTTVQTTLIPLYESFYQQHGIMLEFPWMNSEWLQLYLSLPYSHRFDL